MKHCPVCGEQFKPTIVDPVRCTDCRRRRRGYKPAAFSPEMSAAHREAESGCDDEATVCRMARLRYRIEVRCRRGKHHYSYVEHEGVRPGKAQRVLDQTAVDIARHEVPLARGEELPRFHWGYDSDEDVAPVTVTFRQFDIEFVVSATPVEVTK